MPDNVTNPTTTTGVNSEGAGQTPVMTGNGLPDFSQIDWDSKNFENLNIGSMSNDGTYAPRYTNGSSNRSIYSDTYASDTFGDIIRGEYNDYQERFQPYETKLLSLAENTQLLDEQLGRITTNVNNSYSSPERSMGSVMKGRYGIQSNSQESQSSDKNNNINKALSTAHAKNNTRVMNGDRQMGLVTGTSGNSRQSAMNATNQG